MTGRRTPPLSARELRQQTQPRGVLNRRGSALFFDISEKLFTQLVKRGVIPPPKLISTGRSTLERWDIEELAACKDQLPTAGDAGRGPDTPPTRRLLSF